jgi:hypothetical protein
MFACVLLLSSLILFNNQKSECLSQARENPEIEHIELLAELPSSNATESSVQSNRHNSGIVHEFISGKLKQLEYRNFAHHQVRMKTQMQIHLDLKPVLSKHSGPYLYHRSSYDDPLAS